MSARVRRHLAAVGLPTGLEWLPGRSWSAETLIDHMSRDKKVEDGRIGFVLTRGIGQAFVSREVEARDVAALLNSAIAACGSALTMPMALSWCSSLRCCDQPAAVA